MKNIESYAARVNGSIMLNANECYKNIRQHGADRGVCQGQKAVCRPAFGGEWKR